jgi:starvation-inducible outer membrane lipoprotein
MCTTLYPYIKNLVGKSNEKVENWRNITEWLDEAGYKTQLLAESQFNNCVPVDIMGKIAHISIKKNRITIEIALEPLAQLPSQPPTEDLNNNHHNDN